MSENKERGYLTEVQLSQIKTVLSETPDISQKELIEKLALPITPLMLRRKLRRMGVLPKARTVLTKEQIEQVKAALSETSDIPLKEIIKNLSLPITVAGLRNRLRKMDIPYKGKRKL